MGLQSLPVAFGVDTAKWITVGTIDITQFAVAAYLYFGLHEPLYAGILTALILPQVSVLPNLPLCKSLNCCWTSHSAVGRQPTIIYLCLQPVQLLNT